MDVWGSSGDGPLLTHGASGEGRLSRLPQQVVLEHYGKLPQSRRPVGGQLHRSFLRLPSRRQGKSYLNKLNYSLLQKTSYQTPAFKVGRCHESEHRPDGIANFIRPVSSGYRFNKICHPSQRPRWQVDKEAISLSRVQQCSSTTRPPEICINLVFKHIHAASSYSICRQFVPFIYCPL